MVTENILDLIGNTPLLSLKKRQDAKFMRKQNF